MPNKSSSKEVSVSPDIYNLLDSDTVNFKIGCMTTVTKVTSSSSKKIDEDIILTPQIANELMVPNNRYNPYLIKNNLIKLGPSVGIMISSKTKNQTFPKGKQGRLLKEMIKHGEKKGIFIFIFHPEKVNWKNKSIKGYFLNNSNKWILGQFGFPTIVYNRIQYRSLESKNTVKILLQKFTTEPDMFVFNSRFLNKWEVNEVLNSFPEGKVFVPQAKKYNRENLKKMLKNHLELFLKPINSSRGQGIIKIITVGNSYKYSHSEWSSNTWHSCSSVNILSEALNRMGVRDNRYLIQQGINLAKIDERAFDLRTQTQKDGTGKWVITGVGARIAGKNKFVTHVPNGGKAAPMEEVLKRTFGHLTPIRSSIDNQLNTICSIIPPQLENELGINLAILSLDIGIDTDGHLWILEINSKPASFDEDDIREKHLNYLTDYFVFAAQKIAEKDDL